MIHQTISYWLLFVNGQSVYFTFILDPILDSCFGVSSSCFWILHNSQICFQLQNPMALSWIICRLSVIGIQVTQQQNHDQTDDFPLSESYSTIKQWVWKWNYWHLLIMFNLFLTLASYMFYLLRFRWHPPPYWSLCLQIGGGWRGYLKWGV